VPQLHQFWGQRLFTRDAGLSGGSGHVMGMAGAVVVLGCQRGEHRTLGVTTEGSAVVRGPFSVLESAPKRRS